MPDEAPTRGERAARPGGRRRRGALALAAAALLAGALAAGAQARVIAAESVLPPGQSGYLPQSGESPHLLDQLPLFEAFRLKSALFGQSGTSASPKPGVTITRDAYGVPAITAGTDLDAWFGAGYAVAEDRFAELELFRRATSGRLAELLGAGRLEADRVARRDFYTDAEVRAQVAALPAALRGRFQAYADGVNAYLARLKANPGERPRELLVLNIDPAPWTALDSARIGIQLARSIPSGDGEELANARALKALGPARFDRWLPLRTRGQIATVPAAAGRFPSQPGRTRADERAGFAASRDFLRGLPLPRAGAARATAAGRAGVTVALPARGGSSHWAIRAPGGRALLFNGPQLGFSIPELFVELEVHAPGLDVRGVTAPGVPVIGIGHNAHIAWGLTSGESDEDDLYAERLDGAEAYRFKGARRAMRCRAEVFKVFGRAAPIRERFCRTVHGPVQARAGSGVAFARRYAIWGRELETLVGLAALNAAGSVQAAGDAVAKVTWNENTLVADDQGNIGWWHPGLLPLRPRRFDERLPYPGTGEAEWRGLLPVSRRPHVVNPAQGWLANWNNMPSAAWTNGDAPAKERIIGPLHRAGLLFRQVARATAAGTFDALKGVDRVTGVTAQQRPPLDPVLRATAAIAKDAGAKAVLETLVAWDGNYDRVDAAGTVDPGVAAWEAFKAQAERRLPRAARRWLGAPGGSHVFDAGGAAGIALLGLGGPDYQTVAGAAFTQLQQRFRSADPAAWREPRRGYEVSAQGLAAAPALKFFDRGTWQQAVELGP